MLELGLIAVGVGEIDYINKLTYFKDGSQQANFPIKKEPTIILQTENVPKLFISKKQTTQTKYKYDPVKKHGIV